MCPSPARYSSSAIVVTLSLQNLDGILLLPPITTYYLLQPLPSLSFFSLSINPNRQLFLFHLFQLPRIISTLNAKTTCDADVVAACCSFIHYWLQRDLTLLLSFVTSVVADVCTNMSKLLLAHTSFVAVSVLHLLLVQVVVAGVDDFCWHLLLLLLCCGCWLFLLPVAIVYYCCCALFATILIFIYCYRSISTPFSC